jgi:hypothetical protein
MTLPASASARGTARADFEGRLARLRERHPLKYFKLGTEVEALSFEEIDFTRDALPADVGIYVKIGGPGAANDIRVLGGIGVQGLIAPMIESPYGLLNFVQAVDAALEPRQAEAIVKGINLETVTCYRQFEAIAAQPSFARLGFCNIGRSDLAASMDRKVSDPEVLQAVADLVHACRQRRMGIHVGGQVTGPTLEPVLAAERPDGFHTRFLAFACTGTLAEVAATVAAALDLEIAYLALLAERFPSAAKLHLHRRQVTGERLEQHRRWAESRKLPQ